VSNLRKEGERACAEAMLTVYYQGALPVKRRQKTATFGCCFSAAWLQPGIFSSNHGV